MKRNAPTSSGSGSNERAVRQCIAELCSLRFNIDSERQGQGQGQGTSDAPLQWMWMHQEMPWMSMQ
jgi:hypothetical protein